MINVVDRILYMYAPQWAATPMRVHQDLDAKVIIKVEVLGDTGPLVLYPVEDTPGGVRTLPGSVEPTTIDFNARTYSCPIGIATFKIMDN